MQVQPVAELVELSRRWASDGRSIRLNDAIAQSGGTLRRTGSLRHRQTKVGSLTTIYWGFVVSIAISSS